MRVQIVGWRSKNLRGYLRDFKVNLSAADHRWTLLQMPNGTGKTTTMDLLRIAFKGIAPDSDTIMSFRADDTVTEGFFELNLLIDDNPHNIRLNLNFRSPRLTFQTGSIEGGGLEDGHRFPISLQKTFASDVTELFVFDGEMASKIISEKASDAEKLIRSLYRLDTLSELQKEILRELDTKKRSSKLTQASTATYVAKLEDDVNEAKAAHALLKESERSLNTDIRKHKKEFDRLELELKTFANDKKEFEADQLAITSEVEKLDKRSSEQSGNALRLFRSPPQINAAIRRNLDRLGSTLETNKLPRSLSSDFFRELAQSKKCVCGRLISEHEKSEILDHMDDYLAIDEIAVINHMRSRLQSVSDETRSFTSEAHKLKATLAQKQVTGQRQEMLLERMKAAGFDNIKVLEAERDEALKELTLAQNSLTRLTRDSVQYNGDWESNLAACVRELKDRERLLDAATSTRDFRLKVEALKKIVARAETLSKRKLAAHVKDKTNEHLSKILVNEKIQVSSIDGYLKLAGHDALKKDSVSEGQKLAVAYAFLAALLAEAKHQLPFIVDSPAVSLDVQIRRTVGELIPPLFGQMLMFVISSEREGFADTFFDLPDAQFFTIALDTMTGSTSVTEGLPAFKAFHVERSV